jgi:hypothetical protein
MDLKNIQYNKITFYLATEKPSVTLFYKKTLIGLQNWRVGVCVTIYTVAPWLRGQREEGWLAPLLLRPV